MGLNLPELSLIVSPVSIPKTISDLLREVSMTRDGSEKLSKLDDYVKQLEDEMRKIEAFKRELPLCMLLLNDAIVRLKEEEMQCTESKNRPVMEEFIPLKGNSDEDEGIKMGNDCSEKKNWMSTAQLWSTNTNYDNNKQNPVLELQPRNEEKNGSVTETPLFQSCKKRNKEGGFVPFERNSAFPATVSEEEEKEVIPVPALSLMPPTAEPGSSNMNSKSRGCNRAVSGSSLLADQTKLQSKPQQQHQQAFRKQRRCWSPELHRRFVNALQQLGGTQVATPKQIRELMQVDGLTNDEVKSHLQKYRLHVRRLPAPSDATANNGSYMGQDQSQDLSKGNNSQSNSPQGPLHVAGSGYAKGISMMGGDSMEEEEDEKSDGGSWKGRLHKPGEYDV